MKRGSRISIGLVLLASSALMVACGDDGGDSTPGDGDGDEGDGDGDAGDGDSGTGGETSGDGDGDSEAPADCSILAPYVGEYTVTGPATGDEHRGESTAEHMRGTVTISDDFAIDFDTGISFAAADIMTCYDRTTQDFDRRVNVSYGADDNGEVINVYLTESLEVSEIQFRHNDQQVNVRVLVE